MPSELSQDPTFRLIGSEKTWDRGAALTSRLQTFETEMLAEEDNFRSLARINRGLIAKAEAVKMTRLSCHRFRSNQVRLWLSVIAYNLGSLWRRLVLPQRIGKWSLTSLQQRLVKTGGRLLKHARYYWLLLAESHLTRPLFGAMVRRIGLLSMPAGVGELPTERISVSREAGVGKVSEARVEVGPWGSPEEQNWAFRGLGKHLALQTRLTIAFSGGQVYFIGRAKSP